MIRIGCAVVVLLLIGAGPLRAQRLFRTDAPIEITIRTSLRELIRDRDSTNFREHIGTISYQDSGKTISVPVQLRTRGHFRRQSRNCDFPPLRVDLRRRDVQGTEFQGNSRLKLTTSCRPSRAEYQQYILLEYAAYRVYQLVSPYHYRTRLARITYTDASKATADVTSWAFFVEDDEELAGKFRSVIEARTGSRFDDLDQPQFARTALFEYMIGNTDWSTGGLHNITILRDSAVNLRPVAYDFDWSGTVNARYAFPDARWGIRRVTDRLYIGPCLLPELWVPITNSFLEARPAIEALYRGLPGLEPARVTTALAYYQDFWKSIASQKEIKKAVVDGCGEGRLLRRD